MGGIRYVSVFILTALLIFGCTSTPADDGSMTQDSGDAMDGTTGDPMEDTGDSMEVPDTENLEGLGYSALLALGQSLECDVTIPYGTSAQTAKLYVKGGSDDVRMEISGQNPSCPLAYYVIKDEGTMYMSCASGSMFEGTNLDCDWLVIEPDPTEPDSGYEALDMTDVPPSNIRCKVWTYDATKFATPGSTCNLEDLFQGYMPGDMPSN